MAAKKSNAIDKGGQAEEALKEYFSNLGSYVIRGVPVKEEAEIVTDIDLWVYTRTSAHSRHISIVDIKNKRRGKAFERAIWVRGLQEAVKADEAIIASQGAKDTVHSFANRMDVRVISSSIFNAVMKRFSSNSDKLSYEELDQAWKSISIDTRTLKNEIDNAKSELANGISFRVLNSWIDHAAQLLSLAIEREQTPGPLTRASYFLASLVAVGGDYLGREHSLSDPEMRYNYYKQGLMFGRTGSDNSKTYIEFAESVVTDFADPTGAMAAKMRTGFEAAIQDLPIEPLVEFFAKPNVGANLLMGAKALENACFVKNLQHPSKLDSVDAKIILGIISDYAGLKRKDVLGNQIVPKAKTKMGIDGEVQENLL